MQLKSRPKTLIVSRTRNALIDIRAGALSTGTIRCVFGDLRQMPGINLAKDFGAIRMADAGAALYIPVNAPFLDLQKRQADPISVVFRTTPKLMDGQCVNLSTLPNSAAPLWSRYIAANWSNMDATP